MMQPFLDSFIDEDLHDDDADLEDVIRRYKESKNNKKKQHQQNNSHSQASSNSGTATSSAGANTRATSAPNHGASRVTPTSATSFSTFATGGGGGGLGASSNGTTSGNNNYSNPRRLYSAHAAAASSTSTTSGGGAGRSAAGGGAGTAGGGGRTGIITGSKTTSATSSVAKTGAATATGDVTKHHSQRGAAKAAGPLAEQMHDPPKSTTGINTKKAVADDRYNSFEPILPPAPASAASPAAPIDIRAAPSSSSRAALRPVSARVNRGNSARAAAINSSGNQEQAPVPSGRKEGAAGPSAASDDRNNNSSTTTVQAASAVITTSATAGAGPPSARSLGSSAKMRVVTEPVLVAAPVLVPGGGGSDAAGYHGGSSYTRTPGGGETRSKSPLIPAAGTTSTQLTPTLPPPTSQPRQTPSGGSVVTAGSTPGGGVGGGGGAVPPPSRPPTVPPSSTSKTGTTTSSGLNISRGGGTRTPGSGGRGPSTTEGGPSTGPGTTRLGNNPPTCGPPILFSSDQEVLVADQDHLQTGSIKQAADLMISGTSRSHSYGEQQDPNYNSESVHQASSVFAASRSSSKVVEQRSKLPSTVTNLLQIRKRSLVPLSEKTKQQGIVEINQQTGKTPLQLAFQRQIETLAAAPSPDKNELFEVKTFFDLRDYDLGDVQENRHERPAGSLRSIYLFYARLYEKLIAKQNGSDVAFFGPAYFEEFNDESVFPTRIDVADTRALTMREILDFSADFGLRPHRVGIRDLEQCYMAAYRNGASDQHTAFETSPGLTYHEFLQFLVFLADVLDQNAAKDKLCMRSPWLGRLQRTKRFAAQLQLSNVKKVRTNLVDIWRRTHYWKLDDPDTDLKKVAKILAQNCIPKTRIKPLFKDDASRQGSSPDDVASCTNYLEKFTWSGDGPTWEAFPLPYLDMGVSKVGERKSFKIALTNKATHLLTLKVNPENLDGCAVRLPVGEDLSRTGLPMGASTNLLVEPWPTGAGEFFGHLSVFGETRAGCCAEIRIPVYMKFILGGGAVVPAGGGAAPGAILDAPGERSKVPHGGSSATVGGVGLGGQQVLAYNHLDAAEKYDLLPQPPNLHRKTKNMDFVSVAAQRSPRRDHNGNVIPGSTSRGEHQHQHQTSAEIQMRKSLLSAGSRNTSQQLFGNAAAAQNEFSVQEQSVMGNNYNGINQDNSQHNQATSLKLPRRRNSKQPPRKNYPDPPGLEESSDEDISRSENKQRGSKSAREEQLHKNVRSVGEKENLVNKTGDHYNQKNKSMSSSQQQRAGGFESVDTLNTLNPNTGAAAEPQSNKDITRQLPHFAPKPFAQRQANFAVDLRSHHNLIPRMPRFYPGKVNL
ncbi:unnamed protein product [Amoebophrya sp. A120]|nr:unnamed protein product [Amoebophrya sp. A120]|eukprot:GSA120T00023296001.1